MKDKLLELLNKAYAPYSNFRVSAILETTDGKIYTGVNIENASYGATVCAERVAIFKAISDGYRKGDFKKLHVMVDSLKISSCCFICRQVFSEFFNNDTEIILYNNKGEYKTYTKEELCPLPFELLFLLVFS